jgi:hypothetical protein
MTFAFTVEEMVVTARGSVRLSRGRLRCPGGGCVTRAIESAGVAGALDVSSTAKTFSEAFEAFEELDGSGIAPWARFIASVRRFI